MKHIFSFIFILTAMINTQDSYAQEINKSQWTLMTERTADWCTHCGNWGWAFKTKSIDGLKDEPFVFVAMHTSGALANASSQKFATLFPGSGQPQFYVDKDNIGVTSGNINSKFDDVKAIVEFNKTSGAFAGIGIDAIYNATDKSISINAKVEALQKIDNSDMTLGLYVLVDKKAYQANQGNNADHKNLFLTSAFDDPQGESIFSGSVDKGATFTKSTTINGINEDFTKLTVLGVLWNKNSNGISFFNANEVPVKLQSNSDDLELVDALNVFANESNDIVIDFNNRNNVNNVNIALIDGQGRTIRTLKKDIENGRTLLTLESPSVAGTYFVTVSSSKTKITKQVVIY